MPRTIGLRLIATLAAAVASAGLASCAILSAASKADLVFQREEDPALAAGALPAFIKLSEILLEAEPLSQDKAVTTASLLVTYASAFVDGPSALLPESRFEERLAATKRAGALYRRAFRLLEAALERRAHGSLADADDGLAGPPMARFTKADLPLLYWSAASILAAFGIDQLDFESAKHLKAVPVLLARAEALDPSWNSGAIYELYLPYYALLPDYLGGDRSKADAAYQTALHISGGSSPSLFVSYATSVCLPRDDYPAWKASLERALAINPGARPDSRLAVAIAQDRARALLANADLYFILDNGDPKR